MGVGQRLSRGVARQVSQGGGVIGKFVSAPPVNGTTCWTGRTDRSSPSFAIVATYRGRLPVHHADLYRIGDEDELYATGFGDLVGGEGALLVEWADRIPGALPRERLVIRLSHHPTAPSSRRIEVEGMGERAAALGRALLTGDRRSGTSPRRRSPRPRARAARNGARRPARR